MRRSVVIVLINVFGAMLMGAAIATGHNRIPAIIFVGLFPINIVILRKMRPSAGEVASVRKSGQFKLVRSFRRAGYFYLAALIVGLCFYPYKQSPWWALLVGVTISCGLIWTFLRSARKIEALPPEEWDRRITK
jgi:hypothetical protein